MLCACTLINNSDINHDSKEIRKTLLTIASLARQNKYEIISREYCFKSITIIPSLDQDGILRLSNQNEKISYLKRYFSEEKIVISEDSNNVYISYPIVEINKDIAKDNLENLIIDKYTFRWRDIVFKKEEEKFLIYQIYFDSSQ